MYSVWLLSVVFISTFMCCVQISDNLSGRTLKSFVGHWKCADSARARPRCRRGYATHPLINSLVSVSVFVNMAKTSMVFLEEKTHSRQWGGAVICRPGKSFLDYSHHCVLCDVTSGSPHQLGTSYSFAPSFCFSLLINIIRLRLGPVHGLQRSSGWTWSLQACVMGLLFLYKGHYKILWAKSEHNCHW